MSESSTPSRWLLMTRRKVLGTLLLSSGAVLTGLGLREAGAQNTRRAKILLDKLPRIPRGLETAVQFPLLEAIAGRRARRFSVGSELPDGPLAFKSAHDPLPLSELEQMMVLTATGGNTGWHHMIYRHARYAPHLSNYSMSAGGRTFPSAAGFHVSELFFTDDNGLYFFPTRDAPALVTKGENGELDLAVWLDAHKARIRKLSDGRMNIPPEEPFMEGHNTWCVNRPGSTLIFPVADLAQHLIGILCFLVQNGYCIYDDIHNEKIPGLEKFKALVNVESPYPLSFMERYAITEATAEIATACYAGMLTLQAMGLGGWMFDGIDPFTALGASGNPDVPGLGFRFDTDERWALPNLTGREGVFEAHCPPHFPDMRAAVESVHRRKYGPGGPFNAETPGPWKETPKVRGAAQVHSEEFRECVAVMAQYVFDKFGKFPGTMPSVFHLMYLQAHHLELDFYDHHFAPGAYLETHRRHMEDWHSA
ncbi:MAG: hypothetical protein AB1752_00785 [Candidatus Zixiibacteriota bacterium]